MKLLILLASLLHLGAGCSCVRGNPYQTHPKSSIIQVQIERVKKSHQPKPNPFQRPWEDPGALFNSKVEVLAVVERVHRDGGREFSLGDEITVKSSMSDAMCGIGGFLTPGRSIIFRTTSKRVKRLMLCEFLDFNLDRLQA